MASVVTDVQKILDEAMAISGASGVALVDMSSGMALGVAGQDGHHAAARHQGRPR